MDTFTEISARGKNALTLEPQPEASPRYCLKPEREVAAVDVGHAQMAPAISCHPRVRSIEGTKVRYLSSEKIVGGPAAVRGSGDFREA